MAKREIRDQAGMLAVYGLRASGDTKKDEETLSKSVYKATACGAWAKFTPKGVEIGSIVEGSDAVAGPFSLNFPFSLREWRDTVSEIEDIAEFEWAKTQEEKEAD